jgi:hypothetical protein
LIGGELEILSPMVSRAWSRGKGMMGIQSERARKGEMKIGRDWETRRRGKENKQEDK